MSPIFIFDNDLQMAILTSIAESGWLLLWSMNFYRACIFGEFRLFFLKCLVQLFKTFPVSLIPANSHTHTPHCYSMLRIVRLLPRLVFWIQPKIKIKMNLHYTHTPGRYVLCQWGVSTRHALNHINSTFQYSTREHLRMSVMPFDAVA